MKLTPMAVWRTRACPAEGSGRSTSCKERTSGPPGFEKRMAFMGELHDGERCCSAQVLPKERRGAPIGQFRVGAVVMGAAGARERVIHLGIDMDGDEAISLQAVEDLLLRFGRHELIFRRDVKHQGLLDVAGLTQLLLDVHAVIADERIAVGPRGAEIGKKPTEAITDSSDLFGASRCFAQMRDC